MKTLIAYSTTHGCTEKTAIKLKQLLNEDVTLTNLKEDWNLDLAPFDRIIIGGSIHAGQVQKRVKLFTQANLDELKTKEIGLFICCMEEGEVAKKQLKNAFPEELLNIAKASACFGGEFNLEKMNFLQKLIIKKVAHVEKAPLKLVMFLFLIFQKK
jgi:menaquinone-dependent protoporphyrinogen oxidase